MREIKFRAWDKQNNKWMDRLRVGFGLNPDGYLVFTANENIELMQYTGLKGKNGNEIYEGDIVDIAQETPMPQVIEWHDAGFYRVNKLGVDISIEGYEAMLVFEVIGNIYENKELIS